MKTTITARTNENQRTDDWHSHRLGRFSASEFYRLVTEPRSKADKEAGNLSQGATTYALEKVSEYFTERPAKEEFDSKYTEWGVENEPLARSIYEQVFDKKVEVTGYIPYGELPCGGSPDGLVGDDGIVEFKCPFTITSHMTHLLLNSWVELKDDKPEYYWQCLGYMLITGRNWCDFMSYHPLYPARLQVKRIRITREQVAMDINRLLSKIKKACEVREYFINLINI